MYYNICPLSLCCMYTRVCIVCQCYPGSKGSLGLGSHLWDGQIWLGGASVNWGPKSFTDRITGGRHRLAPLQVHTTDRIPGTYTPQIGSYTNHSKDLRCIQATYIESQVICTPGIKSQVHSHRRYCRIPGMYINTTQNGIYKNTDKGLGSTQQIESQVYIYTSQKGSKVRTYTTDRTKVYTRKQIRSQVYTERI